MPGKPGFQSVDVVRGRGDGDTYQSYGLKMISPRGTPSTDGLQFIWEFERKATRSSEEIVKKIVAVNFTHIVEYQSQTGGANFAESWDAHVNAQTGKEDLGQKCTTDMAIIRDQPAKSCVPDASWD